jgi:hypothetical protein
MNSASVEAIHGVTYKRQIEMKMNNSKETKLKKEISGSQDMGGTLDKTNEKSSEARQFFSKT